MHPCLMPLLLCTRSIRFLFGCNQFCSQKIFRSVLISSRKKSCFPICSNRSLGSILSDALMWFMKLRLRYFCIRIAFPVPVSLTKPLILKEIPHSIITYIWNLDLTHSRLPPLKSHSIGMYTAKSRRKHPSRWITVVN